MHELFATHSFAPRRLIFKLQQVLKLENGSFEKVSIVTFKYLTFLYLITYLFLFLNYLLP